MRVLIVGCGYVGLPLGAELVRQGHEVFGLRRSAGASAELETAGIKPLAGDITRPADLARLPREYDWVVNCVASGGGGVADYRAVYLQGTRNLLEWLGGSPVQKFVYTSSTSVYAQNDGSWVTERSPTQPTAETGSILLETERVLLAAAQPSCRRRREDVLPKAVAGRARCPQRAANNPEASNLARALDQPRRAEDSAPYLQPPAGLGHHALRSATGAPAVVLRLAGIYGPGRGYWLKQFLKGEARLEGRGERFLNQVHREDVIGAIQAALERGCPGSVYNVVDDEPVSQLVLFQWLAERLGRPLPPSVPEDQGTGRKRGATNKRISNAKLKAELGYGFKYPTFREGYEAELRGMGT